MQLTMSGIINLSFSFPFFYPALSILTPAWDLLSQLLFLVSSRCCGQRSWHPEWVGKGSFSGGLCGTQAGDAGLSLLLVT